ncbi:MAG: indole-3-glycerol phosphate synthase TrpC [Chloroflexota bacterium]
MLAKIVSGKVRELAEAKRKSSLAELMKLTEAQPPALDFANVLRGDRVRLIAEVKKASPSAGLLCPDLDAVALAQTYAENGAAAISVLTEGRHFQGSLDYLPAIKKGLGERAIPLLRKDFIFDPYQVYESRASGADALLLIVAILKEEELVYLLSLSHRLGMSCLVEVHNEGEVESALEAGARIIGVNNRDLDTFSVDLTATERLRKLIPRDRIVVSESGIKTHDDVARLRGWGVDAILVGEALVTAPDVATRMRELLD